MAKSMKKNVLVNGKNNITALSDMIGNAQNRVANTNTASNAITPNLPAPSVNSTNVGLQKAQQPVQTRLNNLNNATLPTQNVGMINGQPINNQTMTSRFIGFQQPKFQNTQMGNPDTLRMGHNWNKAVNGGYTYVPTASSLATLSNTKEENRYNQQADALEALQSDIYYQKRSLTRDEILENYPEFKDNIDVVMELQNELTPIILDQGMYVSNEQIADKYNELIQPKNLKDMDELKNKTEKETKNWQNIEKGIDKALKTNWESLSADGVKWLKNIDYLLKVKNSAKKKGVVGGATDSEIINYLVNNNAELRDLLKETNGLNLSDKDRAILGLNNSNLLNLVSANLGSDLIKATGQENEFGPTDEEIDTAIKGKEALEKDFWGETWKNIKTKASIPLDSWEKFVYRVGTDIKNANLDVKDYIAKNFPKSVAEQFLGTKLSDGAYDYLVNRIVSFDEERKKINQQSVDEYNKLVNQDYQRKVDENLNPDIEKYINNRSMTRSLLDMDLKGFGYKAAGETASNWEMPMIIAAGVVSGGAGLTLMATDSFARENQEAYEELREAGADYEQAREGAAIVGLASSAVELGLEKLLGGVETTASAAIKDIITKDFTKRATEMVAKKGLVEILKDGAVTQFRSSLEEGLEEVLQQVIHNAAIKKYDPNQEITQGLWESFEGGFFNPMNLLAGGGDILSNVDTDAIKQKANQFNEGINDMLKNRVSTQDIKNATNRIETAPGKIGQAIDNMKNKVTAQNGKGNIQLQQQTESTTTPSNNNQNTSIMLDNKAMNVDNKAINKVEDDIIELKDVTDLDENVENEEAENQTTNIKESLGDKVWDSLSGIEENTRNRMKKNPYSAQENKALIDTIERDPGIDINDYMLDRYDAVLDSIEESLNKEENRRKDVGKLYQKLEETNAPIDATNLKSKVSGFLQKMEDLGDILSTSDQSKIKTILENIQQIGDGTMDVWKARKIADQRAKRGEASTDGLRLIREIRDSIDEEIRNQRPEMKEVDQEYRKSLDDIRDLKGNLVNKRTGEFKGNAVNIVKNMLSGSNRAYLQKLEKYIPGIKQRLQAIRDVKFVYNAYETGNGSRFQSGIGKAVFGNIFKFLGATGGIPGVIAGAAVDAGVEAGMKSLTRKALRETVLQESERSRAELEKINQKIEEGKQLEAQDKQKLREIGEKIVKNAEEAKKTKAEQDAWNKYFEDIKNKQALPESIKLTKVTEINKPTTPNKPKNKVTKKNNKKSDSSSSDNTTPPSGGTPTGGTPTTDNGTSGGTPTATNPTDNTKNKVTKKKQNGKAEAPKQETKKENNQTKKFTYDEYGQVMNKIGEVEKKINNKLDKQYEQERAEKMSRFEELRDKEDKTDAEGKELAKLAGELNNMSNKYDRLKEDELEKQAPELLQQKEELQQAFDRDWKAAMDKKMEEMEKPFNDLRDEFRQKLRDELGIADDVILDEKYYNSLTPAQKETADRINKEFADRYEELRKKTVGETVVPEIKKAVEKKQEKPKKKQTKKEEKEARARGLAKPDGNLIYSSGERKYVPSLKEGLIRLTKEEGEKKFKEQLGNAFRGGLEITVREDNESPYYDADRFFIYNPDREGIEEWEDRDIEELTINGDNIKEFEVYNDGDVDIIIDDPYIEGKEREIILDLKDFLNYSNMTRYIGKEHPRNLLGGSKNKVTSSAPIDTFEDLDFWTIKELKDRGDQAAIDLYEEMGIEDEALEELYKEMLIEENETPQRPSIFDEELETERQLSENETAQTPTIFEEDLEQMNLRELDENETPQANEEEMNKVTKKQAEKPKNLVTSRIENTNQEIQEIDKDTYFDDIVKNLKDHPREMFIYKDGNYFYPHYILPSGKVITPENTYWGEVSSEEAARNWLLKEAEEHSEENETKKAEKLKEIVGKTAEKYEATLKRIESDNPMQEIWTSGDYFKYGMGNNQMARAKKESEANAEVGTFKKDVIDGKEGYRIFVAGTKNEAIRAFYEPKTGKTYRIYRGPVIDDSKPYTTKQVERIEKFLQNVDKQLDKETKKEKKEEKQVITQKWLDSLKPDKDGVIELDYKGDERWALGKGKEALIKEGKADGKYLYNYGGAAHPQYMALYIKNGIVYEGRKGLEDQYMTTKQEAVDWLNQKEKDVEHESTERYTQTDYETLPKTISVESEAEKAGPKRIAPDRVKRQQETYDQGLESVKNVLKQSPVKIYELGFKSDRSKAVQNILEERKRIRQLPESEAEKQWNELAKSVYEDLVIKDISKGYRYPEDVTSKFPRDQMKKAVDARARYEKGLFTSFSAKDTRANNQYRDEIGAGIKSQDGKPVTQEQMNEIVDGIRAYSEIFGIDMKKFAEDNNIIYVHLHGGNPFLMGGMNIGGLYRRDAAGNISVSLGGKEGVMEKGEDGEMKKTDIKTTTTHEITHAVDGMLDGKLFSNADIEILKKTMNKPKKLINYYNRPHEIVARAVEQYAAHKIGKTYYRRIIKNIDMDKGSVELGEKEYNYVDRQAYWDQENFDKYVKPIVEKNMKEKMKDYMLENKKNNVLANDKNKITSK